MDLMGHTVDGRYAITYRIHVGGMATVYLAHDQFLRRSVVLKVLHPSLALAPAYVERFRREACIAAALSHPNLISVYNLGTYAGTHYIVMEHVTGPSLGDSPRVSEVRALQITAQVAAALAAAHERGVIHRDIRSHNILLAAGEQVKVTDFGCAHTTGSCATDPAQAAPGDMRHRPLDGQSDLYDLGLVLLEMLTSANMTGAAALSPSAWAALRLSPGTDIIVRRALAPNAAHRFPTADAMRAAAEKALSQVATGATNRPHSFPVREATHFADSQPRIGLTGFFRPRPARLAS
ncbi:MAG: protein kinase [Chloroflexota bacterium]|nr:protein kinase [Chloroflexota bacterium]MDQ6905790.1 protein kinase [Chloroflexota bacterium]